MATPTPTLITDRDLGAPWLEMRDGYLIGERRYLVPTHDEAAALKYSAALGTAWGTDYPDLKLVAKRTDYWCGKDVAGVAPTAGGSTIVVCSFEEPRPGGRIVPDSTTKYTELSFATETQTVFFERRGVAGPVLPLANGEGFGRKVGTAQARVFTYRSVGSGGFGGGNQINWARLFRLTRLKPLNNGPLTLPALLGTPASHTLSFGPGQVQYEQVLPPRVVTGTGGQRLLEIGHELSLAPDFLFRWEREDAEGNGIGQIASEIYDPDDLSGLW
jgi:hypothetical protein